MIRKWITVLVLGIILFGHTNNAYARWWVFGKAEDIPEITSLFVGETEVVGRGREDLMLDVSSLEGDELVIKGFAVEAEASLAVAKISLDGGETWEQVKIEGGSFIYRFKPEEGKLYKPRFKVMDTAGKESEVEDIDEFVLSLGTIDMDAIAKRVSSKMVEAYMAKDLSNFMDYISDSFEGDAFALEDAIQSDFDNYDNVTVDVSVQQVSKSGEKITVDFEFNFQGIRKSDGYVIAPQRGRTTYIFIQEGDTYKLLSMRDPIIFGFSRASEIATGSLGSVVDDTNAILGAEDTYISLTVSSATLADGQGIDFSTGAVAAASGDVIFDGGDVTPIDGNGGAQVYVFCLSCGSIDNANQIASDADWNTSIDILEAGYIYGVQRSDSTYAFFRVSTVNNIVGGTMTIEYKYQPDGSTFLP
ncbi:hypothetical protein ACFL2J_04890 [Candidatus Omnitrophota bacterium]